MADDIVFRIRGEGVDEFIKQMKAAGIVIDDVGDEAVDTGKKIRKSVDDSSKSFKQFSSVLKGVAAGIGATFSVAAIVKFAQVSVKAAGDALKAEAQLLAALDGRVDVQKRLLEQAKQLQSTTIIEDDAIVAQQAYLASLNFTESQIRDIINAAVDYSAGANKSIEEAVGNLAKTYSGASRELGALIPEVKNLTDEQFRNGEAVKIVSELYKGQAEVLRQTGTGPIQGLNIAIGELQEELGKALLEGLAPLADELQKIAQSDDAQNFFKGLGTVVAAAFKQVAGLAQQFKILYNDVIDIYESTLTIDQRFARYKEQQIRKIQGLNVEELDVYIAQAEALKQQSIDEEKNAKIRERQVGIYNSLIRAANERAGILEMEAKAQAGMNDETENAIVLTDEQKKAEADRLKNLQEEAAKLMEIIRKGVAELQNSSVGLFDNFTFDDFDLTFDGEGLRAKTAETNKQIAAETKDVFDELANELNDTYTKEWEEITDNTNAAIEEQKKAVADAEALKRSQIEQTKASSIQAARKAFDVASGFIKLELQQLENSRRQGLIGEKEYQQARSELLTKQAKADKANAVFQIGIDTAAAIVSALKAGPIAGPILAGIIGALAAAQLAKVLATDIPQFAKGTKYVDGKGHPNGVDTVPAYLTKGERVVTVDKNKKYWDVLNAIHDDRPELIMKAIAKMGIPVQFKATQDELFKPMTNMQKLISGSDRDGIDLNPLIMASDRSRFSLGRKLDKINDNLTRMVDTRKMTKA